MGVSTKEIDRIVWAIVEYCRLCDSEGKDVVNGRFNQYSPTSQIQDALDLELYSVLSRLPSLSFHRIKNDLVSCRMFDSNYRYFSSEFLKDVLAFIYYEIKGEDCFTPKGCYYRLTGYELIYYITSFVNQYYDNISYSYLVGFSQQYRIASPCFGFCGYYCAYVHVRKSPSPPDVKIRLLKSLIDDERYKDNPLYQDLVVNYNKILGVERDDSAKMERAMSVSRKLLLDSSLESNPAIIAIYCDCLIWMFENRSLSQFSKSNEHDLNYAITKISDVCSSVSDYATYPILHGRLLYLKSTQFSHDDKSHDIRLLELAKSEFSRARKLIDRNSYDYFSRLNDLSKYEMQCNTKLEGLSVELSTKQSIESVVNNIERKIYLRMLELLGLFTAIIAIIITTVQNITSAQSIVIAQNLSSTDEFVSIVYNNCLDLILVLGIIMGIAYSLIRIYTTNTHSGFCVWIKDAVLPIVVTILLIVILVIFVIS